MDKEKFAKRFKELREEMNITQKELADKLDVKRSTVGSWEAAHRWPELEKAQIAAELFGVSLDYLLGRSDTRKPHEFDKLDPETIKLLKRANKLTPAAMEQFKASVKLVFEWDAKERELEKLRKREEE